MQAYNGLDLLLQLVRQGTNHAAINYAKFQTMVTNGVTSQQATTDMVQKYVLGQDVNFSSLSRD